MKLNKHDIGLILSLIFIFLFAYGGLLWLSWYGSAHATVTGITADNYLTYEKPIKDPRYGYNKGEADLPYMEGEELFYNDVYDHWNVDEVYDECLIPMLKAEQKKATIEKKTTKAKKSVKKVKKSKQKSKKAKSRKSK